jgi:hypothetical protein
MFKHPKASFPVGSMRNQCTACGLLFGGLTAFERHRVGDFEKGTRRCLSLAELQARKMVVSPDGFIGMPAPSLSGAGRDLKGSTSPALAEA